MSNESIRAVVFDLGGTLEDVYYDNATRLQGALGLLEILKRKGLDPGLSPLELRDTVIAGIKRLYHYRDAEEREQPPEIVWTEYIFPDGKIPQDRLRDAAEELTVFYENNFYTRTLRPEVPEMLSALASRGLKLAVISNVLSRGQVLLNLTRHGIAQYFYPIVTSAGFRWRKPNARIFVETARLMNLPSAACAYVGDTVSRDVIGARRAGYALAIQIKSFLTSQADHEPQTEKPDAIVTSLSEIVSVLEHYSQEVFDVAH